MVTAIDAFADKQTLEMADGVTVVDCDAQGFKADALLHAVSQLDASQYEGFVYGSGFEAQPELLQKIADMIPLIGNKAATVSAIKAVDSFFSALKKYNIPHPSVQKTLSDQLDSSVYLVKHVGGCGGTHISIVGSPQAPKAGRYFQQLIEGQPVSLLFVANGHHINVIGFNEQWLSATAEMPFRYGGAVAGIELPKIIQQQLINDAEKLTAEFGLLGLNSLDAIVRDDIAYVLEVNPRLSATFDLYSADSYQDDDVNMFDLHILASLESHEFRYENVKNVLKFANMSKAHAIVYAAADVELSSAFKWPGWVVDTPLLGAQQKTLSILAGQPVCTVLVNADNANEAKLLAQAGVKMMQQLLQQNS